MGEADSYANGDRSWGGQGQQQQWNGQQQQQYQYQQGYNQNQQQQYQQPPPQQGYHNQGQDQNGYQNYGQPPPYSYNPPKESDPNYTFDQAFKIEKPKWNDLWAGILLILFFAGFVAVSAITIRGYVTGANGGGSIYNNNNNSFSLNNNTIILFAFGLAVAFVLSWVYLTLARVFPKQFIWITGILNIVWALGTAIFYLYKKYWSAGIVFLLMGLFTAFAFWTWIPRIPFSALMLKTAINVSKKHGHVYLVSLIGGVIAIAIAAWFSVTLTAIYVTYEPSANNPKCGANGSGCSKGKVIGLIAFVTFTMYWVSEWLKNTIHTIIAGVYGSWYFSPNQLPKGATRGSAKRALTYSFGSISLGSLLIAIVQFLRQLCSIARQQSADEGGALGIAGYVLFCILGCLISLLVWLAEFLNKYAFCHIALYGKAYFAAASDTFKMLRQRGIDALINDCLIGPVLSFGGLFVGFATALLAYLYLLFTDPAYNKDGGFTPVVVAFAFLMGMQVSLIMTTPISSGVETIFVAAGWDPQVMIKDHSELYQEMVSVYPQVQQAISVR